jgi:hypothetical protein
MNKIFRWEINLLIRSIIEKKYQMGNQFVVSDHPIRNEQNYQMGNNLLSLIILYKMNVKVTHQIKLLFFSMIAK